MRGQADCPQCSAQSGEPLDEEAGGIYYLRGYDCPTCGQMLICRYCGHWDFDEPRHAQWCDTLQD